MERIVGIDLGTTNSGVAVVRNGVPQMLPNGDERIIPSVVGRSPRGEWLVGTPARNQLVVHPEQTVRSIKREMGTEFRVTLGERTFRPQEISAFILRELKRIAERTLGEQISDAVITVPAYFSDAARQATREAGQIAGFTVRRIINEPTAAALAYGLNLVEDQMVLVYDLGGGTFDASVVELVDGVVEVRASHGNTRLGGDDFDCRLAEIVATHFEEERGVDLREDRRAWARLIRAAEQAKVELSSHPFAWIREEYIAEKRGVPLHVEYEVSRQQFERAIAHLLEQTLVSVDRVLGDAELTPNDIDQVFLVGGSTRVPAVWDMVAGYLDIEPHMSINPEEVVALGAGVQAGIVAGKSIDAILVDVTPYSLGIEVAELRRGRVVPDLYNVIIRRNTTIPVTREEVYSTLHPDQDTVQIKVYQGESPVASENTLLGKFTITDLEPERPGELATVTVQFDFGVDGILKVTARDRNTGQEKKITVDAPLARLSETEILKARLRVTDALASPGETASLSAETAALMERAEQLLEHNGLDPSDWEDLTTLLADIREAQNAGDAEQLEKLQEALLDMLFDLEEI
ncbi:MAG: Hsp70 family protein [Chloroflexota bacterium]|nr:Hsp70 family protein [Chloroflexota bacterium]